MAKEYIEREEVLKEQKTFTEYDEGGWDAAVRAVPVDAIKNFPAADVVEVVRCKDCKHYDKHGYKICTLHSEPSDQFGAGVNIYMERDDFCSYGERRDNNDR